MITEKKIFFIIAILFLLPAEVSLLGFGSASGGLFNVLFAIHLTSPPRLLSFGEEAALHCKSKLNIFHIIFILLFSIFEAAEKLSVSEKRGLCAVPLLAPPLKL